MPRYWSWLIVPDRVGSEGASLCAGSQYGAMRFIDVTAEPVGTIPLSEVSGLALGRDRGGRMTVAAIGDRKATIAWAAVSEGLADLEWQTLPLRDAQGTRIPHHHPQLEAIAMDGALGLLLVQETPCRAEYIDISHRRVLAHVTLDIPDGAGSAELRRSWRDPDGSHAEGVVMLRDGHLLIVKEKDPAALLEFGPADQSPRGFGPGQWLEPGDPWWEGGGSAHAQEVPLVLLAAWSPTAEMASVCPDLSDAEVGPGGNLVLLSDKGSSVAVVPPSTPAPDPFAGSFQAAVVWRLSGVHDKPEGVVVLPDGGVLVACDRPKVKKNLFVVPRDEWDRG